MDLHATFAFAIPNALLPRVSTAAGVNGPVGLTTPDTVTLSVPRPLTVTAEATPTLSTTRPPTATVGPGDITIEVH